MPRRLDAWLVVGVSTAVNMLAWSARSTFALFYVAILEELGWGRGPTALGYSLAWLGFVVFGPVAGALSDGTTSASACSARPASRASPSRPRRSSRAGSRAGGGPRWRAQQGESLSAVAFHPVNCHG
jgi:hypothetical protein